MREKWIGLPSVCLGFCKVLRQLCWVLPSKVANHAHRVRGTFLLSNMANPNLTLLRFETINILLTRALLAYHVAYLLTLNESHRSQMAELALVNCILSAPKLLVIGSSINHCSSSVSQLAQKDGPPCHAECSFLFSCEGWWPPLLHEAESWQGSPASRWPDPPASPQLLHLPSGLDHMPALKG